MVERRLAGWPQLSPRQPAGSRGEEGAMAAMPSASDELPAPEPLPHPQAHPAGGWMHGKAKRMSLPPKTPGLNMATPEREHGFWREPASG